MATRLEQLCSKGKTLVLRRDYQPGKKLSEVGTYSISAQGPGGGSATTTGAPRGRAKGRGGRGTPSRRELSEGADSRFVDGSGRGGKRGCSFDGGRGRSKGRGGILCRDNFCWTSLRAT